MSNQQLARYITSFNLLSIGLTTFPILTSLDVICAKINIIIFIIGIVKFQIYKSIKKSFIYYALIATICLVAYHIYFDTPIPASYHPYPNSLFLQHLLGGCYYYFCGKLNLIKQQTLFKGAVYILIAGSLSVFIFLNSNTEFVYQYCSYTIMWALPYTLLKIKNISFNNPTIWTVILAIIAILATGKRTPLLAPAIGGIIAYLIWTKFSIKKNFKLLLSIAGSILILYIVAHDKFMLQYERWNSELSNTGDASLGNGRNRIWGTLLLDFSESSQKEQVYGQGFQATKTKTGDLWGMDIGAHNDFIDTLVNYGYIGLVIHLTFSLTMLIYSIYYILKKKPQSYILLILSTTWIITELISSNNTRISSLLYTLLFFYLIGSLETKNSRL